MDDSFNNTRRIDQILIGLELEKYLELFHNKNINSNIFMCLTEEDLNYIGVEDKNDAEKILKYVVTMREDIDYKNLTNLANEISGNEAAIALTHSFKDFRAMITSLKIMECELLKTEAKDELVEDDQTASREVQECLKLYHREKELILNEMKTYEALIMDQDNDKPKDLTKKNRRKFVMFAAATAVIAIAVYILHKKL